MYACASVSVKRTETEKRNRAYVLSGIRTIILGRHFFHLLQFLSNLLFLNNRFGFVDLRARLLLLLRLVFSLTHSLIAIINKIMRGNDENRERITQLEMKYQFWSLNTRPFVRACSCGRLKTFVCSVDDR